MTARFPWTRASSRPAIVLNVVPRRRSSGGPEPTTVLIARSPSASLRAAASSPFSGLLTDRASPKASTAAAIIARTLIVPRMTHSERMSLSSDLFGLATMTVPTHDRRWLTRPKTGTAAMTWDPTVSVTA